MTGTGVWVESAYLITAICFIVALKFLNAPRTARWGNWVAAAGMTLAIVATLAHPAIQAENMELIAAGIVVGSIVGAFSARKVQMTAMPEMVALLNGLGGGAVALVATIEFMHGPTGVAWSFGQILTIVLSSIIGSVSFSGSLIAFGKLHEVISGRAITYPLQKPINILVFAALLGLGFQIVANGGTAISFASIVAAALVLGILLVIPIGGADMPVVISLLNSFTGLAAGLAGFVLDNTALLTGGALVGASGLILTFLMCAAMNRSLENVLFGAFGQAPADAASDDATARKQSIRSYTVEDAAIIFANADSVIIVPGYGMAVAQAQHVVKALADALAKRNVRIRYAIHPVAGRMPGHMNVLLAEADVPYDQLYDLEEINPYFPETDIALIIGANDVTNPAARYDKTSPIYGMPILDVDRAETVMVCKRSLSPGYAGIDNELYSRPNTIMLFGDAKATISKLAVALESL